MNLSNQFSISFVSDKGKKTSLHVSLGYKKYFTSYSIMHLQRGTTVKWQSMMYEVGETLSLV